MTRIPLLAGAYTAKSIIASAQKCVNLFPEDNPAATNPPTPVTHYLTPGIDSLVAAGTPAPSRCTYASSAGKLYTVIGGNVYYVTPSYTLTLLGTLPAGSNPVSMNDNGLVIVIVDGSPAGYVIDMTNHNYAAINDASFYGSDSVSFLDTYFLFNRPGTNQWYISLSQADYAMFTGNAAFDSLDIAAKTGYADPLAGVIPVHGEVWVIGTLTTEIWNNTGGTDFAFTRVPNALMEHGCVAKYSICKQDVSVFWISKDEQGKGIVLQGSQYQALRVSTHAIENEWSTYADISDAVGYIYQQEGHTFYVLNFPTANKTWAYDIATEMWHERAYNNGTDLVRQRQVNCASAYGKIICGDWETGSLYELSTDTYTDNGQPISRIRSFPHIIADGNRISYLSFIADMAVGNSTINDSPVVGLRWSDNRGQSYGNAVFQSLGNTGQYITSIQWSRLGMARDRVFELSWSANCNTALQGGFVKTEQAET